MSRVSVYRTFGCHRWEFSVYRSPSRDTLFIDFGRFVVRFGEGWL